MKLEILENIGRWSIVTNGSRFIVLDGPLDTVSKTDFRYGFATLEDARRQAILIEGI